MTIAVYAASVALATACIVLFFVAVRRLLGRQEEIVAVMLGRYDDRLAEFAQTLNDAVNRPHPTPALVPEEQARAIPEHGVMRLLELAKERMSADAAVAVVSAPSKEPMLATVGLSQAEVAQVGRMGVPDYRGARALQVAFNGEAATPPGSTPIRSGLAVPLLDVEDGQGMLAVLTRAPDRRFSELDITTLEDVVSGTRPALEASLELREPDAVPELDALTELYDRRAFHALLDRELGRGEGGASHWRCSCSTSTGSRRSTRASAILLPTTSSSRSQRCFVMWRAETTSPAGSEAAASEHSYPMETRAKQSGCSSACRRRSASSRSRRSGS